jgi:putative membrane protein
MAGDAGLPAATKLSVDRTRLAHERTLMAWVRTSTSLITFGFTIYKFFEYLRESKQVGPDPGFVGARGFALVMISVGLTALALATVEHRRNLHAMRTAYGELVPYSPATVIASLVAGLGIPGLVAVLFRQ